ncbi:hypothetical protein ACQY0O_005780 [Thecaphora frezii]
MVLQRSVPHASWTYLYQPLPLAPSLLLASPLLFLLPSPPLPPFPPPPPHPLVAAPLPFHTLCPCPLQFDNPSPSSPPPFFWSTCPTPSTMSDPRLDDKKELDAGGQYSTVHETVSRPGEDEEDSAVPSGWPAGVDEKKLLRKIDLYLIPFTSWLYLLSFLDRGAIGNARIYGLQTSLHLSSTEYALCLTVFFLPYAFFEVPSNILLKRLRPSFWFPLITILVGICMACQGVVHNFGGLLGARFALGLAEAGLFPGVNALLAGWYRRNELGKRTAIFFSAATLAGAFGGLLSYALNLMDGVGGYEGWRWIFIIIGIVTFVTGIAAFWLCHDFPDTARFLSDQERRAVVHRLQQDQQFSAAGEEFQWIHLWRASLDWKTIVAMAMYAGCDGPLYAFSLFTPSILRELGYTANRANLTSIPIYVVVCLLTVMVGFLADRTSKRSLYNIGLGVVGVVGYAILIGNDPTEKPGVSYFACYLAAAGIYPMIPNTITLVAGNSEGAYTRAVVMAVVISFGNANGAATSNIYPSRTAPHYQMGHGIVIGYLAMGILASALYYYGVERENRKRDAGLRDERILAHELAAHELVGRDLAAEAAALRAQDAERAGFLERLLIKCHLQSGGTYATVEEAKKLKGDNWSGYRYRT